MTQTAVPLGPGRAGDLQVIGSVSAAHFVSHIYMLLLPPLFIFVRAEYGVSYTELGLALSLFNVFSAALQTPAGFLVDQVSARVVLIGGLLLGAGAFAIAGFVDSFWVLVAMFAVAGIGNAVYHPANYSMLSHQIAPERLGSAFSIHTFAGMAGSAVAPASLILVQSMAGWRGAFLAAAFAGLVIAALLALQPEPAGRVTANEVRTEPPTTHDDGWKLLLSAPIIRNLIFFVLFSLVMGGMQGYSVVALAALHDTSITLGNAALSGYLLMSAIGVLVGGLVVGRTSRHGLVAMIGLLAMAAAALLVAFIDLAPVLLVGVLSLGGFFFGAMMPSRDMIVREVTPPGSFGKVFGFVTTGFNIGGIFSPLMFGALMDHGAPRTVFLVIAAGCLLSIVTVATRQRAPAAAR